MSAGDAPRFDLQSHSTHSDGSLSPAAVVAAAAAAGVELLALTDHDTVGGVGEALTAGARLGVTVVPAVELSAVDADVGEVHVLGYRVDHGDPALAAALEDFRADRARRVRAMAGRLRAAGLELEEGELDRREDAGVPLGRPQLAAAVLSHPGNRDRLAQEGVVDHDSLFTAYLVPGAPGHVARARPSVSEAVEVVHAAGGVAAWAHPFWDVSDPGLALDALRAFAALGVDGVEAFYITHTREQTLLLDAAAAEHDLLTTGSADFHGPEHERFNAFRAFELFGCEPRLGVVAEG